MMDASHGFLLGVYAMGLLMAGVVAEAIEPKKHRVAIAVAVLLWPVTVMVASISVIGWAIVDSLINKEKEPGR